MDVETRLACPAFYEAVMVLPIGDSLENVRCTQRKINRLAVCSGARVRTQNSILRRRKGTKNIYGIIIIGARVTGPASIEELSRYRVSARVLEREGDMCCRTSKANSTIVHARCDTPGSSLIAKLNAEGNEIMPALSKELDSLFNRCGSSVVCVDGEQLPDPQALYERGTVNGVRDLEVITDQACFREMEPNLADEVVRVLYTPAAGIVCPFNLNIVLVENAYTNDIDSRFNTEVRTTRKTKGGWAIDTNQGMYETRYVANTAGVHADYFHNMVSETEIRITPRRGDYRLSDKSVGNHVNHTIFALSGKYGKGVLVSPTVHDNLVVGPAVIDIEGKEATATIREGLDEIINRAGMDMKDLSMKQVITSFAGLRAHEDHHELIVEGLKDTPGLVDYAGIKPPGLTSCPTIGRIVAGILRDKMGLEPNPDFVGTRQGIPDPDTLTREERVELIREDPAYGNIICCYGMVIEGEILGAIHRPLRARSLDGIKRRTRAEMERCQTGFCISRSTELLHRELGIPMTKIARTGDRSQLVVGFDKDRI